VRLGALVVSVLCLATAGCGSHTDRLARADVAPLIALAHQIAGESACAQKRDLVTVRARAIALVNRDAVPSDLQEQFLAGVNDLADRTPACEPTTPQTPAVQKPTPKEKHDRGKHNSKDKHGEGG
jgi:hypothetical protein